MVLHHGARHAGLYRHTCRYVDLANCSFGSTAMEHLGNLLQRPQLELCILKGERERFVKGLFPIWQRRTSTRIPVHPHLQLRSGLSSGCISDLCASCLCVLVCLVALSDFGVQC